MRTRLFPITSQFHCYYLCFQVVSSTLVLIEAFSIPRLRADRGHSAQGIFALTERQLQFWEDVEDGLDDIESFFEKDGKDIKRMRQFTRSAKGETSPPTGCVQGHEPSAEHVEGLAARPFWDAVGSPEYFPWAQELEAQADIIIDEFKSKLLNTNRFASDSVFQNQVMGDGWGAIRLQRLGVWNTKNCEEFPETYTLLKSLAIPFAVRGVCFARQAPRSGVQPHSDGRNFILTSHLGLQIPQGCWIEVAGERRGWEQGKLTTLDTSFTHSTGNPSNQERHVLIIDYWHPELTDAERTALEFIYNLRNKYESGTVPVRKPTSVKTKTGVGGWWKAVAGGGS